MVQPPGPDPARPVAVPEPVGQAEVEVATALAGRLSEGLRRLRVAVAPELLLDPAVARPLLERRAEALVSLGRAVRQRRTLGRHHERVEKRRGGQVGDAEAVAHEVVAVAELGLQAVEAREHTLARGIRGARAPREVAE